MILYWQISEKGYRKLTLADVEIVLSVHNLPKRDISHFFGSSNMD